MNMLRMGNSGSWSRHVTGWRTWLHSGEQIERNCNDIGTLSDSSKSRIQDTINKCRTEKMLYWHSNFCMSACCISLINIAGCDMCVICLSLVWHCLGVSQSTGAELRDRVLTQNRGNKGPGPWEHRRIIRSRVTGEWWPGPGLFVSGSVISVTLIWQSK